MERLSMRKIREYLRLRFEAGLSGRQIAASLQVSRGSVGEYERRFVAAGLSWPLSEALSDTELERRLFPPPPAVPSDARVVPDWAVVHRELRGPGTRRPSASASASAQHPPRAPRNRGIRRPLPSRSATFIVASACGRDCAPARRSPWKRARDRAGASIRN